MTSTLNPSFLVSTIKKCSVENCGGKIFARGLCAKHWHRLVKHGSLDFFTPRDKRKSTVNAVRNNLAAAYEIDPKTGCWNWLRYRHHRGYGQISNGKRMMAAHKYIYELKNGPVPAGLELDHLCRNPSCVNPDHLEAVTHKENMRRGIGGGNTLKTICKNGHAFTPENTTISITKRGIRRACKACAILAARNRYRKLHGIPLDSPLLR